MSEAYENLVPDSIIDGEEQPKQQDEEKKVSVAKHSSFIVTINPNYGRAKIETPELRKQVGGKLLMLYDFLRTEFSQGRMLKKRIGAKDNWKCPPLENIGNPNLQVGPAKGWIHMHFIVGFSGEVHIDVNSVRAKSNEVFDTKTHVDVKYYRDTGKIVKHYVGRDAKEQIKPGHFMWQTLIPDPEIR